MQEILIPLSTFKAQFDFTPEVNNNDHLLHLKNVVIVGMGGSAICVNLLKTLFPELRVELHNSYGLPSEYKEDTLFIFNSYSGDTEEVLDSLKRAMKERLPIALLSKGGKLLEEGRLSEIPFIQIPDTDLEPRFSIGYQLIGLLTLMGEISKVKLLKEKIQHLSLEKAAELGKDLSDTFKDKYIILYSSSLFYPVAYLIKAAINEGAKLPAFVNILPEANHNELQSFVSDEENDEHTRFAFLFLQSSFEHERIAKRMHIMEKLYSEKHFAVRNLTKDATDILEIFEVILVGYYLATYLAIRKDVDPYKTPFIKEFKERMAQ